MTPEEAIAEREEHEAWMAEAQRLISQVQAESPQRQARIAYLNGWLERDTQGVVLTDMTDEMTAAGVDPEAE